MRLCFVFFIVGLSACQPAPVQVPTPTATPATAPATVPSTTQVSAPSASILALLNRERAGHGRGPIVEDARLSRAPAITRKIWSATITFPMTGATGHHLRIVRARRDQAVLLRKTSHSGNHPRPRS